MEEWKEYKLGEVVIPVKDRIETSCLDSTSYISTENMLPDKAGVTLSSGVPSGNAVMFKNEDILISNIRPYFKKIWRANRDGGCSADVICLRASNAVDPLFLYYLLCQDLFFDYVMQGAKGTKMPRGDRNQIMQWPVLIPSKNKQHTIASILCALDDKIEVNRRINDNLESLAKKLFRLWCLKNSEGTMELKLADIADFTSGYSYKGNELVPSNIAMATIKNFDRNGGFKMDGFKEIQPSDKLKESQIAEKFDILVAHTDLTQKAEVIGNAELLLSTGEYDQIIYSMDLVKVKPLANFPYQFLLTAILRTDEFKAHCLGYVNGTTVLHLSKKGLPEYEFAIPSSLSEQREMNTVLGDIYKKQSIIVEESRRLRALRDSILPKLMSGAIKVDVVNM